MGQLRAIPRLVIQPVCKMQIYRRITHHSCRPISSPSPFFSAFSPNNLGVLSGEYLCPPRAQHV